MMLPSCSSRIEKAVPITRESKSQIPETFFVKDPWSANSIKNGDWITCEGRFQFSSKGEGSSWLLVDGVENKPILLASWDETMELLPHAVFKGNWSARIIGQIVIGVNFDGSRSLRFENIKKIVFTKFSDA